MSRFYMMIGISGSGKTTYAHSLSQNAVVLSSDEIRKELYGKEEEQGDPAKVFELMFNRTMAALRAGKDVIYDATNVVRKRRVALLQKLPKETFKVAVVVATPIQECLDRNKERERRVPRDVIMKQLRSFEVPLESEGFNHITVVLSGTENDEFYLRICNRMSHDNPHHKRSVGEHIQAMVKAAKDMDYTMYKLCKYHDIGKALTKTIDENGIGHFYGHENVSAYIALNLTADPHLAAMVGAHMKLHYENFHIEKLEKYFSSTEIDYLRRLKELDETYA